MPGGWGSQRSPQELALEPECQGPGNPSFAHLCEGVWPWETPAPPVGPSHQTGPGHRASSVPIGG